MPAPTFLRYSASTGSFNSVQSGTTETTVSTGKNSSESTLSSSGYDFAHALEIQLHEKVLTLSGDSFQIRRLDTRAKLFRLKNHAYSLSNKKILYDSDDRTPIYMMAPNILSLKHRMHILRAPSGEKAFTLRKVGYIPFQGPESIDVWRGALAKGLPCLRIEGNFFERDYRVWSLTEDGESIAASVKMKKGTVGNMLLDRETFILTVEKDVDIALIIMLATSVAEHWHRWCEEIWREIWIELEWLTSSEERSRRLVEELCRIECEA